MRSLRRMSFCKCFGAVLIVAGLGVIVFAADYLSCGSLILVIGVLTFTAGSV